MNRLNKSLLIILLTGFPVVLLAQPSFPSDEMKNLVRSEMTRYQNARLMDHLQTTADENIDVHYYRLDIRITTSPQYLRGKVTMFATSLAGSLDSITLDLMGAMAIDSIRVGGHSVSYLQGLSNFLVRLDRIYTQGETIGPVEIFYEGVPGSSGFGSFEFSTHGGSSTPWVWTLSEPYGAKDWWPCKDHPNDKADSVDIYATVDSSFKVGSNGKLVSVTNNGDGTATWYWKERYPISTYLVSLAITNYSAFSNWFRYGPADSMEVLNYVLPENLASAQASLPDILDGLSIFSDLFGLYPFITEKYGHSQFGWGGGMEHQTMTSIGGFGESLITHELAHQWFGDMITCRTWPDIWLNEGFATYCEALYQERKYGTSSYWSDMSGIMTSASDATLSTFVPDSESVGNLFDWNRVYAKGATILHMLRHVVGDSAFFHSMVSYAHDPALRFGTATTADFRRNCETISGMDLKYFFDEWVYGVRYPKYLTGWNSQPESGGYRVDLSIGQSILATNPSFFKMPVDIRFAGSGMDTTVTVMDTSAGQAFSFQLPQLPTTVQLDPQGWILKNNTVGFSAYPAYLDFGGVHLATTDTLIVKVRNTMVTSMSAYSITSDAPQVVISPTSAIIPAGGTFDFTVTFTPSDTGDFAGHLTFNYNGPSNPVTMNVNGRGIRSLVDFNVAARWNIVSLPATVSNPDPTAIFPTAISSVFSYSPDSGYVREDTLLQGIGYWVKFPAARRISLDGQPIEQETISVHQGWNLIGALATPLHIGQIASVPPAIISSKIFGYRSSYYPTDTIQAGSGYWVKVSQPGLIVLDSSASFGKRGNHGADLTRIPRLTVSDGTGNSTLLYLAERRTGLDPALFEAPPLPPAGAFDARFSTGTILAVSDGMPDVIVPVQLQSDTGDITLRWDCFDSDLRLVIVAAGRSIPVPNGGTITLNRNPGGFEMLVTGTPSPLPTDFMLEGNYPNPFNPSTSIRYALPVDAAVKLTVYNLLGERITELVNANMPAGVHSVTFDASVLPSGIYFYRMDAVRTSRAGGNFSQTRSMLLLR